ncbi:MAG: universal stress protein [Chitinophagaceae bacterium]|nr:universal stress protein [Oligoflexus sp.]
MQITLAVDDNREQSSAAISLLKALDFEGPILTDVVSVIEMIGRADVAIGVGAFLDNAVGSPFVSLQKKLADEALEWASQELTRGHFTPVSHVLYGNAARSILHHVTKTLSELLVLGSEHKSPLDGFVTGSVGRKTIIHSPISVLLARTSDKPLHTLKVVLATDHSAYANDCLELLRKFSPRGFDQLVVTTVLPAQVSAMASSTFTKEDAAASYKRGLYEANGALIGKMKDLCGSCFSRVEEGDVCEVLSRVMLEEKADMLVLGAQGHGFADRLLIGSVSLKMAAIEPKSVFILRRPIAEFD